MSLARWPGRWSGERRDRGLARGRRGGRRSCATLASIGEKRGRVRKWDSRVVQPEDWVKCRVGKHGHVPGAAHKVMDRIVHILNGVVATATPVSIAGIGEGGVAPLIRKELVRQVVESLSVRVQFLIR